MPQSKTMNLPDIFTWEFPLFRTFCCCKAFTLAYKAATQTDTQAPGAPSYLPGLPSFYARSEWVCKNLSEHGLFPLNININFVTIKLTRNNKTINKYHSTAKVCSHFYSVIGSWRLGGTRDLPNME